MSILLDRGDNFIVGRCFELWLGSGVRVSNCVTLGEPTPSGFEIPGCWSTTREPDIPELPKNFG